MIDYDNINSNQNEFLAPLINEILVELEEIRKIFYY